MKVIRYTEEMRNKLLHFGMVKLWRKELRYSYVTHVYGVLLGIKCGLVGPLELWRK